MEATTKVFIGKDEFEKGKKSFDQALNDYSHMTPKEFYSKYTGLNESLIKKPPGRSKRAAPQQYATVPTCTSYPAYKNWAEEGKVAPIKNQGQCGCCYIFAALACMESAVAIKHGTSPPSYSEQQNLDCISNGCNGGWHTNVWPLSATNNGVVRTADYAAYTAIKGATCNNNLPKDARAALDIWYQLPEGNEASAVCFLNTNGPLWVALYATGSNFMNLGPNGIYDDPLNECAGQGVNHAVNLVGYGTDTNPTTGVKTDYWILRNSWGTSWGK
jgi:C1A family cysteine protease